MCIIGAARLPVNPGPSKIRTGGNPTWRVIRPTDEPLAPTGQGRPRRYRKGDELRRGAINLMHDQLLLVLSSFARSNPYCFPGNLALAEKTGRSPRAVQTQLRDMEWAGMITAVYADPAKRHRIGILLHSRPDPDNPVVGPTDDRKSAIQALTAHRKSKRRQYHQRPATTPPVERGAPRSGEYPQGGDNPASRARRAARESRSIENKDENVSSRHLPSHAGEPIAPTPAETGRDGTLCASGEGEGISRADPEYLPAIPEPPTPDRAERIAEAERNLAHGLSEVARFAALGRPCPTFPTHKIWLLKGAVALARNPEPSPGPPRAVRPAVAGPTAARLEAQPRPPRPEISPGELTELIGYLKATPKRAHAFAAKACEILGERDNTRTHRTMLRAGEQLRPDWIEDEFKSSFAKGIVHPGKCLTKHLAQAVKDRRRTHQPPAIVNDGPGVPPMPISDPSPPAPAAPGLATHALECHAGRPASRRDSRGLEVASEANPSIVEDAFHAKIADARLHSIPATAQSCPRSGSSPGARR